MIKGRTSCNLSVKPIPFPLVWFVFYVCRPKASSKQRKMKSKVHAAVQQHCRAAANTTGERGCTTLLLQV